jgi:hypothetical protein
MVLAKDIEHLVEIRRRGSSSIKSCWRSFEEYNASYMAAVVDMVVKMNA